MAASILTNSSAMIALQTLRSTNKNLEAVNNQISTGKKVATAKDSAAVFAISKVMESDVAGFKAIQESLSLGGATATVGNDAANQLNGLLNEIKAKVVSANEDNVDRDALQSELVSLRNQISGVVGAAQFNGLNLLSNTDTTLAGAAVTTANIVAGVGSVGTVNVLSSLDRSSTGSVTTSSIGVARQDLGTGAAAQGSGTDLAATAFTVSGAAAASGGTSTLTVVGDTAAARGANAVLAGDSYQLGGLTGVTGTVRYVARDGDTVSDIAAALTSRINFFAAQDGIDITASVSGAAITLTNNTTAAVTATSSLNSAGTVGGGLELLSSLDISTENGASAALGAIESLIQTTVDAQAAFGPSQKRIDLQNEFMGKLVDSFKLGIGALVDADLEEASARLQALQVQQQLGIQSLSIANQAPQNILALFR